MQIVVLTCALALGGITTSDGTERGYWNSTGVVYCEIMKVEVMREIVEINGQSASSSTTKVVLKPIATLAGTIDPSSPSTIRADAEFGVGWSAMYEPPAEGSKAVVVIDRYENQFSIPNGGVLYMPNKRAIMEVNAFDDPKVTETIENLRKLRSQQHEKAEQTKAEQKAAAEKKGK
jgi:hypothetical protein